MLIRKLVADDRIRYKVLRGYCRSVFEQCRGVAPIRELPKRKPCASRHGHYRRCRSEQGGALQPGEDRRTTPDDANE